MRGILTACFATFALALNHAAASTIVVDFEDLGLPPNSYDNGSSGAGGFVSGGAFLNNSYNPTWDVWSGWAVSSKTDATTPGYSNQYSAMSGGGAGGSLTYAVAFAFFPNSFDERYFDSFINLPDGYHPESIDVTNTTYAALSMRNGDQFSKKFGGASGTDPDYFVLTITGFDQVFTSEGHNPGKAVGSVSIYLADYRFGDSALDYILTRWVTVDLSSLTGARSLGFGFQTSDMGPFGPNTPTYAAIDNLRLRSVIAPEPASAILVLIACGLLLSVNKWRGNLRRVAGN